MNATSILMRTFVFAISLHSLAVGSAAGATAYGVTADNVLFRFDTADPTVVTTIGSLPFTPEGIDFRPGTQQLYAIDVGQSSGGVTRIYKVDKDTAATGAIGAGFPSQVTGQQAGNYSLIGQTIGFDFNPTTLQADGSIRIRVVASGRTNLRVNSDTGMLAAIDTPVDYPDSDPNAAATPALDGAAYINTAFATSAAGTTTLYDIDASTDDLATQVPANAGTLNTVGPLGAAINALAGVGFDIYTDPNSADAGIGGDQAFAVFRRASEPTLYSLYDVNLATGAATNKRIVGGGADFTGGFAVLPAVPPHSISINDVAINEGTSGPTQFTFTVSLSSAATRIVNVKYSTAGTTAVAGSDYNAVPPTNLSFAVGETSKTVTVNVFGDTNDEINETFIVELSDATNALIADSSGTGTIVDDDVPGIAIATSTNFTDNDAPPGVTVRVGSTVTYDYAVTNTANVAFSSVTVTDDNGTPADPSDDFAPTFLNGDANGNGLLNPGETWNYSTTRIAAAGQFSHTGRVAATPLNGDPGVTASDPENQIGIVPTVLANISTRLRVETGDRVLIGGFIIAGNDDKKVIVRAIGPSLGIPGQLEDPRVQVYNSEGGLIAENNNWQDAPNRQEIVDSTIAPSNDLESAFLGTLAAGAYTAIVSGVGGTSGIGLVEVYDLDRTVDSDLANIATRGFVQTGDNVLIGGLIVTGEAQLKVLIRGIGPSLNIAGGLADPTLELVNANGETLLANDNWRATQESDIEATTIPPPNDLEPAILTTLPAANYTALLRGRDGTTGIGLVEIYALK